MTADVVTQLEDYRRAAGLLYGDVGEWTYDAFDTLNDRLFNGALPPMPITWGLSAYGRCWGLTRGTTTPRILLVPSSAAAGHVGGSVGTLAHEMVHADLGIRGLDPKHAGKPWAARVAVVVARLPPGFDTGVIAPVRSVRSAPGAQPRKGTPPGCWSRVELAGWNRHPAVAPALAALVPAMPAADWLH